MREVVVCPYVVGFEQANREPTPNREIHSAAQDGTNAIAGVNVRYRQPVVSKQRVSKEGRSLIPPSQARSDGRGVFSSGIV